MQKNYFCSTYKPKINMFFARIFLTLFLFSLQEVLGSSGVSLGIRRKTYHAFFSPLSWPQAYLSCRRMNMFLATFQNELEYQQLKSLLSSLSEEKHLQSQRLWLGGGKDSSWDYIWADNGKLVDQFSPWGPRQPDNYGDCLVVFGGSGFRLANWPCEQVSYYVCHSIR